MSTAYGQKIQLVEPPSITGCSIWLDASLPGNFGFSSGSNITTWYDRSGNARHATATTSPTYDTVNKRVQFTRASNQYMSNLNTNFNLAQRSIFIVLQQLTNNLYSGIMPFIPTPNTGADYTDTTGLSIEASYGMRFYGNSGGYDDTFSSVVLAKGIYADIFSNPNGSGYLNGNNQTTVTSSYTPGISSGYVLGTRWNAGIAGNYFNGYIHEIVVYNSALSTTDRQTVEGYLAWKWNLVSSLPANHPYKTKNLWAPVYPPLSLPAAASNYPLFQPTQLSNCVLWLDGADKTTLFTDSAGTARVSQSGQLVSCWKDKSVSQNHASNTATQPTALFNAQNGLSVLNFDGATQFLNLSTTTLPTGSTQCSFFFVTRTTLSDVQVFFTYGTDPNTTNQNPQFYYSNSSAGVATLNTDTYGAGGLNDNTNYLNAYVLSSCTFTSVNAAWDNGAAFSGGTTNITLNTGTGWASVGVGRQGNTKTFYLLGQIAEIIVYSRPLSTTERQNVEGYLAWKWNLAGNLTASQPWKSTRFNTLPPFPSNSLPLIVTNKGFRPTSYVNNVLWLDGADPTQVTVSGTAVTQWKDKSGSNNNTSSANGSPQYSALLNKKKGVVFNGSSSYFALPVVVTTDWSIFIVLSSTASRTTDSGGQWWAGAGIFDAEVAGTSTDFGTSMYNSTFATGVGNPPTGDNTVFSSTAINTGAGMLCEFQRISSSGFIENFVNGTSQGSTTGGTGARLAPTRIVLGAIQTLGAGNYFNGNIFEIVAYSSYLTSVQRQTVEGYLAWKWGIQGSLPSTHPYKLFPPPT